MRSEPLRAGAPHGAQRRRSRTRAAATWRSCGADGLQLAYHWLDPRGNAIVWDGAAHARSRARSPRASTSSSTSRVDAPRPPGALRAAVRPRRGAPLLALRGRRARRSTSRSTVAPRIAERRLARRRPRRRRSRDDARRSPPRTSRSSTRTPTAVAHLVAGASRRRTGRGCVLDAHAEGWAAVGPALVPVGGAARAASRGRRARRLGAGRAQPALRRPAPPPVARRRARAGDERRACRPTPGRTGSSRGGAVVRLPTRSGRRPR